jgi:hypothetical protein
MHFGWDTSVIKDRNFCKKTTFFFSVTPKRLVNRYQPSKRTYCSLYSADGFNLILIVTYQTTRRRIPDEHNLEIRTLQIPKLQSITRVLKELS